MFPSGGDGMWPTGGSGQPSNPTWPSGGGSNPAPGGWPSGPGGGGSNPAPGGWPSGPGGGGSNPAPGGWPSAGGSHPAPGGWPSAPQGGGSNPAPGGWPSAPQGGGSNPAPGGWPSAPQGGGSNPAPGGWPSAPQGGGSNPAPGGWPSGGGSNPAPGGWPAGPSAPSAPSSRKEMRVPYTDTLLNGVYDKLLITITGTIKSNPQKFTVDLSKGRDIAFHFNARFNENGRQVIVMNTFNGGRWGQEQRESRFPFSRGQQFEMKILCTPSEYKVAVNGSHLVAYRHRMTDLRAVNSIGIYFDLDLTNVKMETLP